MLRGKWVYFFGDSTIRQIWVSYAAPFQDNKFERNAKEWTRHYCAPQTTGNRRKIKHVKGGDYPDEVKPFTKGHFKTISSCILNIPH